MSAVTEKGLVVSRSSSIGTTRILLKKILSYHRVHLNI